MNKFRVWDKQNKKYLSEEELKKTFINHKGKLVHATGGRFPYEWHEDRFIVEWYTGLKGKNCLEIVEIYEGDIVNAFGGEEHYGSWEYKTLNHEVKMYSDFVLNTIISQGYEIVEIIGNIHENKELLEVNNEM